MTRRISLTTTVTLILAVVFTLATTHTARAQGTNAVIAAENASAPDGNGVFGSLVTRDIAINDAGQIAVDAFLNNTVRAAVMTRAFSSATAPRLHRSFARAKPRPPLQAVPMASSRAFLICRSTTQGRSFSGLH